MANQNMLKLILIKNCVIDVENGTARISEDVFNTLFGQTLYSISAPVNSELIVVLSRSIGN